MNKLYILFKKEIQRALAFVLFSIVLFQYGNAQCTTGIDTVCTNVPDTVFINSDAQFTSYNWLTNHGATLNVLPGDTVVIIDWSTSSILNGIDSTCVVGTDNANNSDTLCKATYIESCVEICNNGIDDDSDGLIDSADPDCNTSSPSLFTPVDRIKRVGAPTICDILTANPADPIGALDCDGGGQTNLDECNAGQDPEDASDDAAPYVCPDGKVQFAATSWNQGAADDGSFAFYVEVDGQPLTVDQSSVTTNTSGTANVSDDGAGNITITVTGSPFIAFEFNEFIVTSTSTIKIVGDMRGHEIWSWASISAKCSDNNLGDGRDGWYVLTHTGANSSSPAISKGYYLNSNAAGQNNATSGGSGSNKITYNFSPSDIWEIKLNGWILDGSGNDTADFYLNQSLELDDSLYFGQGCTSQGNFCNN